MPNPAQTAATVTPVRAADIVWTAALIGAFYLAKTVSRAFGFHLPGSSMVLWLVPVLVARWRLDRPGSALVVSLAASLVAARRGVDVGARLAPSREAEMQARPSPLAADPAKETP